MYLLSWLQLDTNNGSRRCVYAKIAGVIVSFFESIYVWRSLLLVSLSRSSNLYMCEGASTHYACVIVSVFESLHVWRSLLLVSLSRYSNLNMCEGTSSHYAHVGIAGLVTIRMSHFIVRLGYSFDFVNSLCWDMVLVLLRAELKSPN